MLAAIVSIHTRHYWRVKPAGQAGQLDCVAVSIHTRHYWRVKRFDASTCCTAPVSFNPHPPLLAGETCALARASKIGFMRFNPHPPLLAGETAIATLPQAEQTVSIHTRHYWRVKLVGRPHAQFLTGFNPHPPLLAGETTIPAPRQQSRVCFNPHPPLLAGETSWMPRACASDMFQSTPAITGG